MHEQGLCLQHVEGHVLLDHVQLLWQHLHLDLHRGRLLLLLLRLFLLQLLLL